MSHSRDPKKLALDEQGVLHPEPDRVADRLFQAHDFFDPRDLVQVKYEMVRRVERDGLSVTEAAETFGFSRPTFYQARAALEREGLAGLLPKRPGPRKAHKLSPEIMDYLEEERSKSPGSDASTLAAQVREHFGISLHPRTVERALARKKKRHSLR